MEANLCPFCREEVKSGAIKCKHCGSTIVDITINQAAPSVRKQGTLWLPIPSLVVGIITFLALFDDSYWDYETIFGFIILTIISFTLGVVSLSLQREGKGMAIAGIALSSMSFLALIGMNF